jgi:hypothetical protein
MPIYDAFNLLEAVLWGVVAAVIHWQASTPTVRHRLAVSLGCLGFVAFGITDTLEVGTRGFLPSWLWSAKIACGALILISRFTWRGWRSIHWRDRELLFALACLGAVTTTIVIQRWTTARVP